MPSPIIPRSKSAPDISSPDSPTQDDILNPSDKSIRSTRSTGSPITIWPKKLTEIVTRKKSDLTVRTLQEFNKRNASSSPYYKGLIDYSLDINREKLSGTSPGRESRATTFASSGSNKSFAVKFQEWGSSCFSSKRAEKSSSSSGSHWTKSSLETRSSLKTLESVSIRDVRSKTPKREMELERKKVSFRSIERDKNITPSLPERPLRERDSEMLPLALMPETPSMQPVSPLNAVPSELSPYPLPEIYLPSPPQTITEKSHIPPPEEAPLSLTESPPQHPADELIHADVEIITAENETEYIWADKYRPSCLQDFLCNKGAARSLLNMVEDWDRKIEKCGHFIFEGNPGVGKRTMIWALLREAFGKEKLQVRDERKKFYLKGEEVSSIFVNLKVSEHHVEVNLSELKGYEKHVIVELIKENNENLANALTANKRNCKGISKYIDNMTHAAIILYEADRLSVDALSYIKWMLEKFIGKNKIFFCCSNASKLEAMKPMCTFVELLEPSNEEILEVLAFIAQKEGIHLPLQLANQIAENAKHNLRQAIRSFEATWHFNGCCASLKEDTDIKTGWENKIANIAQNVIDEQSPKQLYIIRGELQNLIEHNVAPEFIFQTLKDQLKNILPQHLKPQFDNLYEEYQKSHTIKKCLSSAHEQEEIGKRKNDQMNNVHQFMRIEEFIARFMSWYKRLVIKDAELDQTQSSETT